MGRDRDEIISINWKSFKLGEGHIKLFDFYICSKFLINLKRNIYMVLAKELIMITPKLYFEISVEKIHVTMLRVWNLYTIFISICGNSNRQTLNSVWNNDLCSWYSLLQIICSWETLETSSVLNLRRRDK